MAARETTACVAATDTMHMPDHIEALSWDNGTGGDSPTLRVQLRSSAYQIFVARVSR